MFIMRDENKNEYHTQNPYNSHGCIMKLLHNAVHGHLTMLAAFIGYGFGRQGDCHFVLVCVV